MEGIEGESCLTVGLDRGRLTDGGELGGVVGHFAAFCAWGLFNRGVGNYHILYSLVRSSQNSLGIWTHKQE